MPAFSDKLQFWLGNYGKASMIFTPFSKRLSFSLRLMANSLFVWAALLSLTSPKLFAQDVDTDTYSARKISDIRKDLKVFMKLSKSQDPQTERIAVYNLCQLHREIAVSPKFVESPQLQGMRVVIAKRLTSYSTDFENSLKRLARQKKKTSINRESEPLAFSETTDSNSQMSLVDNGEPNNQSTNKEDDSPNDFGLLQNPADEAAIESSMWNSAVSSYESLNCVSGGPERIFTLIGGQLAPPWDHGQDLVDLITTVIHPNSWRRNGGNASVHYYQPSRVLVLHASLQGHQETSNLLEKLRGSTQPQLNVTSGQKAIGN
ncbi:MAG: hypothetical protein ACPHO8_16325 [Mariniblastus sp.]